METPDTDLATDLPDLRDTPLSEITDGEARDAGRHATSGDGKLPAAFFQSAA